MIPTPSIQNIVADDYVADLPARSLDELRSMKDECSAVETAVSYYRRLAQGRIEILDAWSQREGDSSVESLVDELPRILGGDAVRAPAASTRFTEAAPEIAEIDLGGREALVADDTLANLPLLSAAELADSLAELRAFERELSDLRRRLHGVIDAVELEIATRQAADTIR